MGVSFRRETSFLQHLSKYFLLFLIMYTCMCVNPWVPVPLEVRGIRYPGVTGSCWAPNKDTGNRTQVLCIYSLCAQPPSHLSRYLTSFKANPEMLRTQELEVGASLRHGPRAPKAFRQDGLILTNLLFKEEITPDTSQSKEHRRSTSWCSKRWQIPNSFLVLPPLIMTYTDKKPQKIPSI